MALVKNNGDVKEFIPTSFTDLIDNFFNDAASNGTKALRFQPGVDIVEEENKYAIQLTLPGMKKEDIKIDLHEGKLSVSGERKFVREENKKYHSVQTNYGAFERSLYLPDNAKPEAIEAEYIDGVLIVSIPKDEKKIYKASIQVK